MAAAKRVKVAEAGKSPRARRGSSNVEGRTLALFNVGGDVLRHRQCLCPSRRAAGRGRPGRALVRLPLARVALGRDDGPQRQ